MSHDVLDDLLTDVPRHVTPDPAAAWRAGNQRRRRTYAVEVLAVAAAMALVGLGLFQLHDRTPVQPVGPSKTVDGHPRDVPQPFFERDLPKAPGPAAGVFLGDDSSWHLVSARGETWRLPTPRDWTPVVSADGTQLALMRGDGDGVGHLEVRDLVTGSVESSYAALVGEAPIGQDTPTTHQKYLALPQRQGFWSPDGARLLIPGGVALSGRSLSSSALVLQDGSVSLVPSQGTPAGWASPSTIVWLSDDHTSVVITGLDGTVVRTVRLAAKPRLTFVDDPLVSPDGTKLALVMERDVDTVIRVFSLATGEELPRPAGEGDLGNPTRPVWRGDDLLWWRGPELVDPTDGSVDVRLSDGWSPSGIAWTPGSLSGPAHDGPNPFGWRYWPVWWWWKQILGGSVALVVILGIWWLDRRDRKTLRRAT